MSISLLAESCNRTRKLVLVDDSKSGVKFGDVLVRRLQASAIEFSALALYRQGCAAADYGAVEDRFTLDYEQVRSFSERPDVANRFLGDI